MTRLYLQRGDPRGLDFQVEGFETLVAANSSELHVGVADLAADLASAGHDTAAAKLLGAAKRTYWPPRAIAAESELRTRMTDEEFGRLQAEGSRLDLGELSALFYEMISLRRRELESN